MKPRRTAQKIIDGTVKAENDDDRHLYGARYMTLEEAKAMIARVDAAEKAGTNLRTK